MRENSPTFGWFLDTPKPGGQQVDFVGVNFILMLSPERIIIGGGMMEQKQLFPLVRQVRTKLNGYVGVPQITDNIEAYVVPPKLGGKASILGSFVLAQWALAVQQ